MNNGPTAYGRDGGREGRKKLCELERLSALSPPPLPHPPPGLSAHFFEDEEGGATTTVYGGWWVKEKRGRGSECVGPWGAGEAK